MILDDVQLVWADLVDRHAAAILSIDGASAFPWREPTKKILICICQKPPHSALSRLPNKVQMLLLTTMNYTSYLAI